MERNYDDEMKLPDGKTCADCRNGARCEALFGAITNIFTKCDFWPSRFTEPTPNKETNPNG